MFGWITANREWVFSGLGLSLAAALAGMMRFVWIKAQARIRGPALPTSRRSRAEQLILGKWIGETSETERSSGSLRTYAVTWEFYKSGKYILCKSPATTTINGVLNTDEYELVVKVLDNRFFMIDFYNLSSEALNFGSEVLELLDNGREFRGRFVAYSPDEKDIIAGRIVGRRAV